MSELASLVSSNTNTEPHMESAAEAQTERESDDALALAEFRPWPEYWHGIPSEMSWLKELLTNRIDSYLKDQHFDFDELPPPLLGTNCRYHHSVAQYKLSANQRLLLILAWASEFAPSELDILQTRNTLYDLPFAEFGGLLNQNQAGFQPTMQTALFLMAGVDPVASLEGQTELYHHNPLFKHNLLQWDKSVNDSGEALIPAQQALRLSGNFRQALLYDRPVEAEFGAAFPARKITTDFQFDDLVLPKSTLNHLNELLLWQSHHDVLRNDWGMGKTLPLGYKALFYGPPGTGKTLTASVLGKKLNLPVYRIDLSQVVSKYIGETEKNLERIFLKAEQHQWILFFDEADALFGKRTQVSSSNDRNANMETGYLLQRIEQCPNLVILASNLKDNVDEAFLRRFQAIIHFDNPAETERLSLWHKGFSDLAELKDINLSDLAANHELSGAEINNVIRYASLMAVSREDKAIQMHDIMIAIRREKYKKGLYR